MAATWGGIDRGGVGLGRWFWVVCDGGLIWICVGLLGLG